MSRPWPNRVAAAPASPRSTATTTSAAAPHSATIRNADGTARSTIAVSASWTAWPPNRSQPTDRTDAAGSPVARPCRTARSTSPTTPPGTVTFTSCER